MSALIFCTLIVEHKATIYLCCFQSSHALCSFFSLPSFFVLFDLFEILHFTTHDGLGERKDEGETMDEENAGKLYNAASRQLVLERVILGSKKRER